jgi:N-methylhydantoinase A
MYSRETVFDNGATANTPRLDRSKLLADDVLNGPAIITQHNSTTIVPPGYRARVLAFGDIHISRV